MDETKDWISTGTAATQLGRVLIERFARRRLLYARRTASGRRLFHRDDIAILANRLRQRGGR